jgi:hypothetical protein
MPSNLAIIRKQPLRLSAPWTSKVPVVSNDAFALSASPGLRRNLWKLPVHPAPGDAFGSCSAIGHQDDLMPTRFLKHP